MENNLLPFTFDGWDPLDPFEANLYEVTFTRNFGPFELGETFNCVTLNLREGRIEAWARDGASLERTCTVRLEPGP